MYSLRHALYRMILSNEIQKYLYSCSCNYMDQNMLLFPWLGSFYLPSVEYIFTFKIHLVKNLFLSTVTQHGIFNVNNVYRTENIRLVRSIRRRNQSEIINEKNDDKNHIQQQTTIINNRIT